MRGFRALIIGQIVWVGVFQYCLMRVLMTIVAVVTQALGVYCEASLSPAFAHVWVRFEVLTRSCVSSPVVPLIKKYC